MGKSDGKVVISTELDNSQIPAGIKGIKGSLGGLKSVLKGVAGTIAAAFSVAALVSFSKSCIDLGSDLQEVQNVVDVSFGEMSGIVEEFANNAITQFGMSQLAAKRTASTYMSMAKGMGVAEDAAADMSLKLTGLSGDVASFYNLDQETAAKKLQGVFTGESEALKELGVVMTQTNLKQYALEHGMNANIEAMSQAEQVALRCAFVTDALSLAAGDFARTQNSWANQTKILSMQFEQLKATIGQGLINALTPVIQVINIIISGLQAVARAFQQFTALLFGSSGGGGSMGSTVKELSGVAAGYSSAAEGAEDLEKATTAAGKAAKKYLAGFDEIQKIGDSGSGGSGAGGAGISGGSVGGFDFDASVGTSSIQDAISPKVQALVDKIHQLIAPLREIDFTPLKESLSRLGSAFANLGTVIGDALEWVWFNILAPLAKWFIEDAAPASLDLLSAALDVLVEVCDALAPLATSLWNDFLEPIAAWTGELVIDALHFLADALTEISDWISKNQKLVQTFAKILGVFAAAWLLVNAAVTIWNAIGVVATAVTSAFGAAVTFLTSPIGLVTLAIAAIIAIIVLLIQYWDTVKATALAVWDGIKAVWNTVASWFQDNIIQPVADFFSNMWSKLTEGAKKAWEGIKSVFSKVASFFGDIFSAAWEKVKGVFSFAGEVFSGIKDGIVDAFKLVVNALIDGINTVVSIPFKGLNGILDKIHGLSIAGIKPFKWLTWRAPVPEIPHLAQGAVLPANKPFLAMVGDQKHGTNVEAPLATIQEAVALVMEDYVASNIAGHEATVAVLRELLQAVLGIEIGDTVIGQATARYNAKMAIVRGG